MTDQELIDLIERLTPEQVGELGECLIEYVVVMPHGDKPNDIEAKLLLKTMISILGWKS